MRERVGSLTLMVGTGSPGHVDNRVIFVNKTGQIVWEYGVFGLSGSGANQLNTPVQATYIPPKYDRCNSCNKMCYCVFPGTVLITDQGNNKIIAVNEKNRLFGFT